MIEKVLNFLPGQGPFLRSSDRVLGVAGGIPFVADLGGVSSESFLACFGPSICRVDEICQERPQRQLIAQKCALRQGGDRPTLHEEFVDIGSRPFPRLTTGKGVKAADDRLSCVDGTEAQIAPELLVSPSVEHGLKDLLFGSEQCHTVGKVQRRIPRSTAIRTTHGDPLALCAKYPHIMRMWVKVARSEGWGGSTDRVNIPVRAWDSGIRRGGGARQMGRESAVQRLRESVDTGWLSRSAMWTSRVRMSRNS